MKKHRILVEGDIIQEGDEWRTTKDRSWTPVYRLLIGIRIMSNIHEVFKVAGLEFRRSISG